MITPDIAYTQRRAAKVAGAAFLFGMAIVVFGEFSISEHLIVPGNAMQTAANIMAHQTLFRINIACNLMYVVTIIVLTAALHVVLEPVDRSLALVAMLCRFLFALMWGMTALNMLGALRLLGDAAYLQALPTDQLQVMARLHLAANFDAYYSGLPFFGLASTTCSILWLRSGYVPKPLAAFGLIASAWCVLCAFIFIVFPDFNKTVNAWWFDTPMALFEMAIGFWLVFKGLQPSGSNASATAGASVA